MKVFIQNETGSFVRHDYNEKTLELLGESRVSRAFPFPYGFLLDTTAPDGDNVDCFVLTSKRLRTGQIVDCEPLGLMEKIEDGEEDHKVLATLYGEEGTLDDQARKILTEFETHVFDHILGKTIVLGAFHGREVALRYVEAHASS